MFSFKLWFFIQPICFSLMVFSLCICQWYELIQRKSRDQGSENGLKVCSWRWRGYLIQVLVLFVFLVVSDVKVLTIVLAVAAGIALEET